MTFKFLITDLNEGNVSGTNDPDLAQDLSACEDYFVVDSTTGEWLLADGRRRIIQEFV
jgi:hypothetical protein